MTDKMVDVGGRRSAADIFWSSFPTFTPTSSSDVGPAGRVSAADIVGPIFRHSGRHSVCYPSARVLSDPPERLSRVSIWVQGKLSWRDF